MFGSDWPVCLLAADYGAALELVSSTVAERDRDAVLAETAIRTYRLDVG
jgi:L-fuconolactonase